MIVIAKWFIHSFNHHKWVLQRWDPNKKAIQLWLKKGKMTRFSFLPVLHLTQMILLHSNLIQFCCTWKGGPKLRLSQHFSVTIDLMNKPKGQFLRLHRALWFGSCIFGAGLLCRQNWKGPKIESHERANNKLWVNTQFENDAKKHWIIKAHYFSAPVIVVYLPLSKPKSWVGL